jgi:hypothetical protein
MRPIWREAHACKQHHGWHVLQYCTVGQVLPPHVHTRTRAHTTAKTSGVHATHPPTSTCSGAQDGLCLAPILCRKKWLVSQCLYTRPACGLSQIRPRYLGRLKLWASGG